MFLLSLHPLFCNKMSVTFCFLPSPFIKWTSLSQDCHHPSTASFTSHVTENGKIKNYYVNMRFSVLEEPGQGSLGSYLTSVSLEYQYLCSQSTRSVDNYEATEP